MKLTNNELLKIMGGSVNWSMVSVIGTIISFIAGIVDGYLRPIKCTK